METRETAQRDVQVLIVGSGPTGLTLAYDLARRGVPFRLIEKAPEPFAGSRGKGLQPRTLEVFDDLGVIKGILAASMEYPRFLAHVGPFAFKWDMFKRSASTPEIPYPNALLLPQRVTEALLRDHLGQCGVHVEFATELTTFEQDAEGVTATLLRDGNVERAGVAYLVGADGGHSLVRKALGVGFEGEAYPGERMLIGDVRVQGLSHDYWHVWPRAKGGAITLCPLPGSDQFQLTADLPANGETPELSERGVQALFDYAVRRHSGVILSEPQGLSVYHPHIRMVDRYRVGRVFLAGDAAHVQPPEGGQGLNTGVQDAYNLGWKLGLVLSGADPALLDTYQEERLPVAADVLGLAAKLHTQATQRDHRQKRGEKEQQLDISYRGASLARDERSASSGLRAGDRAPDAPCQDELGQSIRLFDLFRGPHFTLLIFGKDHGALLAQVNARYGPRVHAYAVVRPGAPADSTAVVDSGGHIRRAYGVRSDGLALVRPDGYVGLMAARAAFEQVTDYLTSVIGIRDA